MRFKTEMIDMYLDKKYMTKVKFCIECGITAFELRKVYDGDEDIIVRAAFKIARYMNVKLEDLFE